MAGACSRHVYSFKKEILRLKNNRSYSSLDKPSPIKYYIICINIHLNIVHNDII